MPTYPYFALKFFSSLLFTPFSHINPLYNNKIYSVSFLALKPSPTAFIMKKANSSRNNLRIVFFVQISPRIKKNLERQQLILIQ
jgi:hypothetical protein